jgi:AraC-like DNA-binding protein
MVYIRRFFVFYILHLIISLFPLTVFCLLAGIVGPLFWYVMTPVSVYVLFPNKKTVLISAFCLFLMLSAFALTFILPDKFVTFKYLSHFMILIPSMIDALYIFLLICYCLYFIHRFHRLQIERILDVIESDKKKTDFILLPPEKAEESKYEKIYERITAYFEAEKPYLNANFKIGKMAADLNINTAYLAKAIGMKRSMNFNNFVNFYRIEKAKELIRNKVAKYTLEYIYLSSGFNSQSSFNSAFKLQESITPSEYAKQFA